MPRMRGIWGEPWEFCSRCDFEFPVSSLSKQKGQLVCETCVDNLMIEHRPSMIASVLADGREGVNSKSEKQVEVDELTELEF